MENIKNLSLMFRKILVTLALIFFVLVLSYFLISYFNFSLKTVIGLVVFLLFLYFLFKYPEVSFGLFLVAGFYKADPRLQNFLPEFFDLTIFFGVIVVLFILFKILKRNLKIPRIPSKLFLPYIVLVVLMFVSLLYTEAPIYGWDKFLRFITITTLAIFGPIFLFTNIRKFHRFLYTLVAISSLMVVESIISSHNITGFHTAFGSDYLALGRITGIVSLAIIFYFLLKNNKLKVKLLWVLLLVLNVFGLFYSGGRAPVIAFFLTIIILGLFSLAPKIKPKQAKIIKIAYSLILFGLVFFLVSPKQFSTLFNRINIVFTEEGGGVSLSIRLSLYNSAIKAFIENPLQGLGLGGFSNYYAGVDQRLYPHNILLEIGAELGIIGLILFFFLIGFCFFYLLRLRKRYGEKEKYFLVTIVLAFFVFMFINSCVSGDINDNRLFFVWVGTAYALNNILKKKNENK